MNIKFNFLSLIIFLFFICHPVFGQQNKTAKIAVIQASAKPNQDPFMDDLTLEKCVPR